MKNKTIEEILDKYPCIDHDGMETISYQNANISMHQFAAQQSALAVEKRERQIGALLDQMLDEDHPKAFYKAVVQIRKFLYPTNAEIAQVEPEPEGWINPFDLSESTDDQPAIKVSELKDFLFNMHEVENGKIYLTVENINQFINSKRQL